MAARRLAMRKPKRQSIPRREAVDEAKVALAAAADKVLAAAAAHRLQAAGVEVRHDES